MEKTNNNGLTLYTFYKEELYRRKKSLDITLKKHVITRTKTMTILEAFLSYNLSIVFFIDEWNYIAAYKFDNHEHGGYIRSKSEKKEDTIISEIARTENNDHFSSFAKTILENIMENDLEDIEEIDWLKLFSTVVNPVTISAN